MQQAPIIYLALRREQEEFATLDIKTYYNFITVNQNSMIVHRNEQTNQ